MFPFACLFDHIDPKGNMVRNDSSCVCFGLFLYRIGWPLQIFLIAIQIPNIRIFFHCSRNRYVQSKGHICNIIAMFLYWVGVNLRSIASFSNKGHLSCFSWEGIHCLGLHESVLCSSPPVWPCRPLHSASPCWLPWASILKWVTRQWQSWMYISRAWLASRCHTQLLHKYASIRVLRGGFFFYLVHCCS